MRALIGKEFQTWLQGRAMFTLVGLVVLGIGMFAFLLGLLVLTPLPGALPNLFGAFIPPGAAAPASNEANTLPSALVPFRSTLLFGAGAISMLLMIVLVGPALAATAFGGERSSGTLDLLLLHSADVGVAVGAKLVAATLFVGLLCLVGAASLAPAWMFGGVELRVAGSAVAVLLASLVLASAIGVLLSALLPDTLAAAFLAQAAMLGLTLLVPGVVLVASVIGGPGAEPPQYLLWLSPLVALLGAAPEASAAVLGLAPATARVALSAPSLPVWLRGAVDLPWLPAVLLWLVAAACCWYGACVAIDPCHRARSWRPGGRGPRAAQRGQALPAEAGT